MYHQMGRWIFSDCLEYCWVFQSVPISQKVPCTQLLEIRKGAYSILQCIMLNCIPANDEIWDFCDVHVYEVVLGKSHIRSAFEVLDVASDFLWNNVISHIWSGIESFYQCLPNSHLLHYNPGNILRLWKSTQSARLTLLFCTSCPWLCE